MLEIHDQADAFELILCNACRGTLGGESEHTLASGVLTEREEPELFRQWFAFDHVDLGAQNSEPLRHDLPSDVYAKPCQKTEVYPAFRAR
jgi:hypothetical protein